MPQAMRRALAFGGCGLNSRGKRPVFFIESLAYQTTFAGIQAMNPIACPAPRLSLIGSERDAV